MPPAPSRAPILYDPICRSIIGPRRPAFERRLVETGDSTASIGLHGTNRSATARTRLSVLGAAGSAQPAGPGLVVILQNDGGVPPEVAAAAQAEVARLYGLICVDIAWVSRMPEPGSGVRVVCLVKWEGIACDPRAAGDALEQRPLPGGLGRSPALLVRKRRPDSARVDWRGHRRSAGPMTNWTRCREPRRTAGASRQRHATFRPLAIDRFAVRARPARVPPTAPRRAPRATASPPSAPAIASFSGPKPVRS